MEFKLDTRFLQTLALRNAALGNTMGCKQNYNLIKLGEEASELGLVCIQKHMKPTKVTDKEITDEIGDVLQRIEMYLAERPELVKAVQARIDYKTSKYKEYKRDSLYLQI
mgnify:CR=1 FL=1